MVPAVLISIAGEEVVEEGVDLGEGFGVCWRGGEKGVGGHLRNWDGGGGVDGRHCVIEKLQMDLERQIGLCAVRLLPATRLQESR